MESRDHSLSGSVELKTLARWIGILATLLCIAYVIWMLVQGEENLVEIASSPKVLLALLAACVLWIILNLILGLGWACLIRLLGGCISFHESVSISFRSQFAKYLPGNIFHLAGRVLHGRNAGLSTSMCVLATSIESAMLLTLALLIGFPLLLTVSQMLPIEFGLLILIVGLLALFLGLRFSRLREPASEILASIWSAKQFAFAAICLYAVVFLIQLISFVALSDAVSFDVGWSFFENLQIVSITWLAGFVVIGSPGGLGVREAAFSVFADNSDIRSTLLLVASCMRISSMLGDIASLGLGVLMHRKSVKE